MSKKKIMMFLLSFTLIIETIPLKTFASTSNKTNSGKLITNNKMSVPNKRNNDIILSEEGTIGNSPKGINIRSIQLFSSITGNDATSYTLNVHEDTLVEVIFNNGRRFTCYPGYSYAQYGDTGAQVVCLQALLKSKRTMNADITVDGIFGQNTYNAVYAFQSRLGLSRDGIAGKQTFHSLVGMVLGINTNI